MTHFHSNIRANAKSQLSQACLPFDNNNILG